MIEYPNLTGNILLISLVRTKFILIEVINNDKIDKYRTVKRMQKICSELFINLNQNSDKNISLRLAYKGITKFNKYF
jgi:hypothetical protein